MTILFAVVAVLIWLPFNVNIQSPLSCLLAGGENENLKAELNNIKELHSELKSVLVCHHVMCMVLMCTCVSLSLYLSLIHI